MNVIVRSLIVLALLTSLPRNGSAQEPLARGPLHDTTAAREALAQQVPDIGERDILLITLDSVMLDLLPHYGEAGVAMPNFAAFSSESILFTKAFAPSPNRLSAAVALHHSLYPTTTAALGSTERSASLASRLADAGFTTHGFARPDFFESDENIGDVGTTFDIGARDLTNTRNPATMVTVLERRLSQRRSGERLFGWMHIDLTWPPATYHPGVQASGSFANHYRAALQSIDALFGEVARTLAEAGLSQRTVVILAGLHGLTDLESSGRGVWNNELNERSLQVPLVMHVAGLEARRIGTPVSTLDLAPTILDLIGMPIEYSFQGRSLLDLMLDPQARSTRDNLVFAELVERRGEPQKVRRRFVHDGRLSHEQIPSEATPVGPVDPGLPRLLERLVDFEIYTETCADIWGRGLEVPIELGQPLGELGRARFLARTGHKKEAAAVLAPLISREGDHLEAALTAAIETGIAPERMPAKELLQHPRARIRGLAGAWLAMHGMSDVGLDQALALLKTAKDPNLIGSLLLALGRSSAPRALEAIRGLDLKDDESAARRDLALVRLGDEEAVSRLPRRFLTPQAGYDRLPFFEALAELKPEKIVGLGRLYLENGDGDPKLVRAVLERLERLNAVEAAPSLARAIGQLDTELRAEVVAQLERWKSHAAAEAAVEIAARSATDADFAARVLFELPGLLSSPFVPSLRMDHHCSRFKEAAMRLMKNGASLAGPNFLEFTLEMEGAREGRVAVLFRLTEGPIEISDEDLRFDLQFNDSRARLRTESLNRHDDHWVWVGRMRPEGLEAGLNKIQLRLRRRDREPLEAEALAVIVFPESPARRFMIAGLDLRPLSGAPTTRSGGRPAGDAASYEIYLRRDPFAKVGGEVRVLADGKTFARFALKDFAVPRQLELALPDWAGPESLIELQAVDVPTESGLSALLYGRGKVKAPRDR